MSQQSMSLNQAVRTAQIITIALTTGVVMFLVIAVLFVGALDGPPNGVILSAIAAGFAIIAFVLHLVITSAIARQQSTGADEQRLAGIYLTKTIIGLAVLEGAAFLNIIACIVEHNWWPLAVAGGLVFWMLAMFPTRTRVEHWIETQRMLADE